MPLKYVQPLPNIAELEGELRSGKLSPTEMRVRQTEIYTLQNLDKVLYQFAQNPEEGRRVIDANEEKTRADRRIGYPRINAYRCVNAKGEKRYPIIRVDVTDQSCLFGKGEWMDEDSKNQLERLRERGFTDQKPIPPFGSHETSVVRHIDQLEIEIKALKTEDSMLKSQGSKLYILVADTDESWWCADCSAGNFLYTLKRELRVPVIGCFSSVDGGGESPEKEDFDRPEKADPYRPLIVVDRQKRSMQTLSETPVDQFIEEWKGYWGKQRGG